MRRRALFSLVALGLAVGLAPPAQAATDARVTIDDTAGSYQLADGGTDDTMTRCSEGRRQQNEPTVAVGRMIATGTPTSAIAARYADAPACPTLE